MRKSWQTDAAALLLAPTLLLSGCVVVQSNPEESRSEGAGLFAMSYTDARKRAGIRLQLAIDYYGQQQFAVSVEEAGRALEAVPDFAEAYGMRALAYMEMGQAEAAERDFRNAMALAPGNPDFANNFGWFLCNNGRAAESISYFESAFGNQHYSSPGKALINAGKCSLKLGDSQAARRYLERAFQREPDDFSVNVSLGRLYFEEREFERARLHIDLIKQKETLNAEALWLAIRIERKLGNQPAEYELAVQLRRRYPSSSEYAAYQRGAFDE